MAQMGRPGLSAAQKRELWQRWKAGQSLTEIGRAFEKHSSSIHLIVSSNGGFLPRTRTRRRTSLTLFEREEISRGIAQGKALRAASHAPRLPNHNFWWQRRLSPSETTVSELVAEKHGQRPTQRGAVSPLLGEP